MSSDHQLVPLTDEEFAETGLDDSLRDFSFWDEDGYLVTVAMSQGALALLVPKGESGIL